jgi:tol-pal system protein YbgF
MRPMKTIGISLVFSAAVLLLSGCAATNSYMDESSADQSGQDISELDQMLGTAGADSAEESINEDDVLKLLGVNDETGSDTETAFAPSEQSEAGTESISGLSDNQGRAASSAANAAPADRASTAPAWRSDSYSNRYQEALQAYRSQRFSEAIQKFEALLTENGKNSLADNCQYWIGEAYYDQGNFNQAIVSFQKVFSFPNSNKDDSAQLKLGLCYVKLNDRPKAREEFQKLINNYPSSEYLGIARQFIAQFEGPASSQ